MPREVQKELRRHRRSWQPRPWGFAGASTLPTNTLRSDRGTFPVGLRYILRASEERPFFTGLDELQVDPECGRWLRGVRLIGADRLAFRPVGDEEGDSSHLITSPTPHRGDVWVVVGTGIIGRPSKSIRLTPSKVARCSVSMRPTRRFASGWVGRLPKETARNHSLK